MMNATRADRRYPADESGHAQHPGCSEGTEFRISDDRTHWHPLCRTFYEYCLRVSPRGKLPGRQHISPFDIVPLLPRVWMLDVFHHPLRFRYRLVGTGEVRTLGRELTGQWVDEAHPEFLADASLQARYRYMAECGKPTWRRGPARWRIDTRYQMVENCIVPLAADGINVDILFALSIVFFDDGKPVCRFRRSRPGIPI